MKEWNQTCRMNVCNWEESLGKKNSKKDSKYATTSMLLWRWWCHMEKNEYWQLGEKNDLEESGSEYKFEIP